MKRLTDLVLIALPAALACSLVAGGAASPTATALPALSTTQNPSPSQTPAVPSVPTAPALPPARPPNILFILTDDQDAASVEFMPALKSLIADEGASFANYFVTFALCCPSRATVLRGQYTHNTQIFGNTLPDGGFQKFRDTGAEESTAAVWLQSAGYRTILIGKYLNGYPAGDFTYVPPGWSEWYSPVRGNGDKGFNYALNENGRAVDYGESEADYATDVYSAKAADAIQRAAADGQPFFIYLSVHAPHSPATPAPRHSGLFADAQAPRPPSFNEDDVSDKPMLIRSRPPLNADDVADIDLEYRNRLRSLQAVDEMIASLVAALETTGQLDNTYVVFSSDNGYHLGQHRLKDGKEMPYEEDIHLPLFARGPGIPAGAIVDALAGNVDLAPTFAEWAGVSPPDFIDGRSLVPLLVGAAPSDWRQAFLLQAGDMAQSANRRAPREYVGLRTPDYLYVEWINGDVELYDLHADPYELQNIAASAPPDLLSRLSARLSALRACAADSCRLAESVP